MGTITRKNLKTLAPIEDEENELSLSDLESQTVSDEPDQEVPDDIAFQSIINELGLSDESGKVNVYKLQKGNYHDQIFLFECLPSEFNLTMLQNPEYHDDGYHKFKVILRNSKNIVKAKQLAVMPNAKLFEQKTDVANVSNQNSDIALMLKTMNDQTQALIAAVMAQNKQPIEKPKTTTEFLQEMRLMKEVFGNDNPPPAPAPQQSPMELLTLAKELALAMNPEADTGIMSTMGRMLEKYGEPIMTAIAAQSATTPAVQPNPAPVIKKSLPVSPHGITPNPLPAPDQPEQNKDQNEMSFMMKMYLNQLIAQAKRNGDVNLYADLILDQVGDDIYQLIEQPDWFEKLQALNADVTPYRDWFTRLKTALETDPDIDEISSVSENDLTSDENSTINEVKSTLNIGENELNNSDDVIT